MGSSSGPQFVLEGRGGLVQTFFVLFFFFMNVCFANIMLYIRVTSSYQVSCNNSLGFFIYINNTLFENDEFTVSVCLSIYSKQFALLSS